MSATHLTRSRKGNSTFHQLHVKADCGKHVVSILEDGRILYTSCTCGSDTACDHLYQALSGNDFFVEEHESGTRKLIITSLQSTKEGKMLVQEARKRFPVKERSFLIVLLGNKGRSLLDRIRSLIYSEE